MLVTLLVSQSCIRPYVVSTVSLLVPPAIQSSTTFRRPLLRLLKPIKGSQSGTGITASTVAVHNKRNIKVKQSLMPAVGLLFVHFIFWIWFFFSYTRSGAATRFWSLPTLTPNFARVVVASFKVGDLVAVVPYRL